MKTTSQEMWVYYDPNSESARKVLAYARVVSPRVKEVEYHKTPLTRTLWKQLLSKLDLEPKQILNKANPYYQEHIRGRSFDDEGWLDILLRNPDLIIAPIVVSGDRALLCKNPTDILQLGWQPTARRA